MCMIISRYEDEACIDDDYSCFDDDFTNTDDDFTLYDEFAGMLPEEINDYYVEDDVLEYIRYFYFHNIRCKYSYPLHMFYADIIDRIKCTV